MFLCFTSGIGSYRHTTLEMCQFPQGTKIWWLVRGPRNVATEPAVLIAIFQFNFRFFFKSELNTLLWTEELRIPYRSATLSLKTAKCLNFPRPRLREKIPQQILILQRGEICKLRHVDCVLYVYC